MGVLRLKIFHGGGERLKSFKAVSRAKLDSHFNTLLCRVANQRLESYEHLRVSVLRRSL